MEMARLPFFGRSSLRLHGCPLFVLCRYHLAIRILRGDMYSLDVETNVLSHISILDYEPK